MQINDTQDCDYHPKQSKTTTESMILSWSIQSQQSYLDQVIYVMTRLDNHFEEERNWQDIYITNMKNLLEDPTVPYDVFFHLPGSVGRHAIGAHRYILENAKFLPVLNAVVDNEGNVYPRGIFREGDFELLQHGVASCYTSMVKGTISHRGQFPMPMYQHAPVSFSLPDLKIVASPMASPHTDIEWSVYAYKACLCAHSDYCRSFLSHERWSKEMDEEEVNSPDRKSSTKSKPCTILRLDSSMFDRQVIQSIVSFCCGRPYIVHIMSVETLVDSIHAAAYLGVSSAFLLVEYALLSRITCRNVADLYQLAEDVQASRLQAGCRKFICRNLDIIASNEYGMCLAQLQKSHLQAALRCDDVQLPEDQILDILMKWADETGSSLNSLIDLVRLPFVPVNSSAMTKAMDRNLVDDDIIRLCRLFQDDEDIRITKMKDDCHQHPFFRPRLVTGIAQQLSKLLPLPTYQALMRHQRQPHRMYRPW